MKKTATITWITYNNFGTLLQAYALQQVIQSLGYENKIIDDSLILKKANQLSFIDNIKKIILLILNKRHFKYNSYQKKSQRLFNEFRMNYLNIDHDSIDNISNKYECFIVGSDQIWSPLNFNPYYYANFTNRKKISYAPSIGISHYPEELKGRIKELLSSYSAISTREVTGAQILGSLTGKEIDVVADPTLLLSSSEWNKITENKNPFGTKYILCYLLTYNPIYLQYVKHKASIENKKIVIFSNLKETKKFADIYYPAGPKEFLTAIKYADKIYTDSFHATIFSIIFEKDFLTFKRFKNDSHINQNSRLINLFELAEINDRFISEYDFDNLNKLKELDFEHIKNKLSIYKEHSLLYLTKALME